MAQKDLTEIVKAAEVTFYADSKRVVVGDLVRDVKTGEERVEKRRFLEDCESILTVTFKEPVSYDSFARHAYRYLKTKIPGLRRLHHQRKTKGPLKLLEQYLLEGGKGNETSVHCLRSNHGGYSEFTVCSNYQGAMEVLVDYVRNGLRLNEVKTRKVIGYVR